MGTDITVGADDITSLGTNDITDHVTIHTGGQVTPNRASSIFIYIQMCFVMLSPLLDCLLDVQTGVGVDTDRASDAQRSHTDHHSDK